jgi:hypothetical protein
MNLIINLCERKLTRIETNTMKFFAFSKLWEYGAYCKVKSTCLQDKRSGRAYMNQEWGSHERSFQILKKIINFNSPRKKLILLNQSNKKGHYWRIVGNEISIKVGKSKKRLNILNKNYSSPINNGLNLMKIHVNVISINDITQEFHFKLIEFTILQN